MHFEGLSGIEEIKGKKVGVFLYPVGKSAEALPAEVVIRAGKAFIDCLPIKRGAYVWPIPDDSAVSAATDPKAPWAYVIFVRADTDTGLLIADALRKGAIFRN